MKKIIILPLVILPIFALASSSENIDVTSIFMYLIILLLAAKFAGLIEKIGQPSVLGEIIAGIILGNLTLIGINFLEPIKTNAIIGFLSEFGVVILLFQIGLESNISHMKKVGGKAFVVAIVGVITPFLLGLFIGPWLIPGYALNTYIFLGATLTATSVGITARVFKDLNFLKSKEAQIVLSAAVIDDILGLIVLAVVSAMITTGTVSFYDISWITLKAFLFLGLAIYLGRLLAPHLGKLFSRINTGLGMKFTLSLSFCLFIAFLAQNIGLAPIVGAFAAGLILDNTHFKNFKKDDLVEKLGEMSKKIFCGLKEDVIIAAEGKNNQHINDLIEPVSFLLVPIFFVMTGFSVNLTVLFDLPILLIGLGLTLLAFIGKIVTGLFAGKVDKLLVGVGMVPRGEVGIIFSVTGKSLGVIDEKLFSIIIIMVILSTLLTPLLLSIIIKKKQRAGI